MVTIKTNINSAFAPADAIQTMLSGGNLFDRVMKGVAESVLEEMKERIHEKGLAADGNDIGLGKEGKRVTLNKSGELKNELTVIGSNGNYALGWMDAEKRQRAERLENIYHKCIWSLTRDEEILVTRTAEKILSDALH